MTNWTPLAQGDEGIGVSRCPEGHIHLDYGFVTLRFRDDSFLAFARMVAEAAQKIRPARGEPAGFTIFRRDAAWLSQS